MNNQHIPPQLSLPNTAKNSNSQGMSAQSGLQRAMKATSEQRQNTQSQQYDLQQRQANQNGGSTRGQKDVIIRKNSSKSFLPANGRPQSSTKILDSIQLKQQEANNSALARKKNSAVSSSNTANHQRNKTQVVKKNIVSQAGKMLGQNANINSQDQALLLNQSANYIS